MFFHQSQLLFNSQRNSRVFGCENGSIYESDRTIKKEITLEFLIEDFHIHYPNSVLCILVNGKRYSDCKELFGHHDFVIPSIPFTALEQEKEINWIYAQVLHDKYDGLKNAGDDRNKSYSNITVLSSSLPIPVILTQENTCNITQEDQKQSIDMKMIEKYDKKITFVLPLVLEDLNRASVMMTTLYQHVDIDFFQSLLLIVPDQEYIFFRTIFGADDNEKKIKVIAESTIFQSNNGGKDHRNWTSYAKQMLIKLVISRFISTEFYLTLDADIVLIVHSHMTI